MNYNTGFFKAIRNKEVEDILLQHIPSFALLYLIAYRASRRGSKVLGLEPGEAIISDYYNYGLTRQMYRSALENLVKWQKVTIKVTNKGTIAKLADTTIFDINVEGVTNETTNSQPTANQQVTNGVTTNKNIRNKEREEEKDFSLLRKQESTGYKKGDEVVRF